ncbi:MAG TPA: TCP-1/cpn60 chaperonin family protein, partial [Methanothrix soehngenii]|nr:TCP-1/cpn60 chaperonin family protein [Methanothrix soehngenii]
MAGQFSGTPIFVLREGSQRTAGREAQRSNIMAAKAVAGAVRTTLGPKGMDKMMVDTMGDVVITNDGVTILKEMDIEHPAAKMMVEIAKTQDTEVGDGTTTAVILAGELLKQSEELLEQDIHPTVIAAGYRAAADKCMEILQSLAKNVTANDQDLLNSIAITAMTGKGSQAAREKLADIAVRAVQAVVDEDGSVDTDNITVEKKVGGSISDSKIVQGVVIDKDRLHPSMPKKVTDAKIALLN